jgi:hypothetical protein
MSLWNGNYECTCYHPLFVFNQFSDLEGCGRETSTQRRWESVLKRVVSRYRGTVSRIYFRADASFANPEVYDYLEGECIKYATGWPANRVLQGTHQLSAQAPVGRQPTERDAPARTSPLKRGAGRSRAASSRKWNGIRANSTRALASSSPTWLAPARTLSPRARPRSLTSVKEVLSSSERRS